MTEIIVRASTEDDIGAITEIYAYEVLHGTASFDEVPPPAEKLQKKRADILDRGFPYMVAEVDGEVVAYSYVSPYRQRSAYSNTVENAIYVHPEKRISGIGYILLGAVLEQCEKTDIKQIIAIIGDSDNLGSIKLHKKLGFRKVGTLRDVGFKFGRYLDSVLMQKTL